MRCPICREWIKRGAQKCKHCYSVLVDAQEDIGYLKAGFARIHRECDTLETKVNLIIGKIFKRHRYSEDELLNAGELARIESFSGKIRDDVNQWKLANQISERMREFYNDEVETVHDRLDQIIEMIHERTPTLWDKVGAALSRFYKTVIGLLPLFVRSVLPMGKQKLFEKKGRI
jgi:tetrahydromethanopterin S-methyltransferase subunit G